MILDYEKKNNHNQGEEAYSRSVVHAGRWHFEYLLE